MQNIDFRGRVGFGIGTGRCGTKFLSEVISLEPHVSAVHERNPMNEAFQRYCKWNHLPVDDEGFLHIKELEIREDLETNIFSFESSSYLSLSVRDLYDRFGAKFILMVRSPERVVNSLWAKGLYDKPIIRKIDRLAAGYQQYARPHHFLSRLVPTGEMVTRWYKLTRVGKLAWYWNAFNTYILDQFESIPEAHKMVVKLEDASFDCYLEIPKFCGFQPTIDKADYDEVVERRPNARLNIRTVSDWNSREISEFEVEVAPMAEYFGYECRADAISVSGQTGTTQQNQSVLSRLRKFCSTQFSDKTEGKS